MEGNGVYRDNLLDAAVYSLEELYQEEYVRRNYTSSTSKVRKIIKNLQTLGYIIKDPVVNKYYAVKYHDAPLMTGTGVAQHYNFVNSNIEYIDPSQYNRSICAVNMSTSNAVNSIERPTLRIVERDNVVPTNVND